MAKHLIYRQYLLNLFSKLEHLEESVKILKTDYTLSGLGKLQRELHEFSQDLSLLGDGSNSSHLVKQVEYDVIVKLKNFYYNTSQDWLHPLEEMLQKLKHQLIQIMGEDPVTKIKKKIVVVDDDDDILKLLMHEFRDLGFEVQTFNNGTEALTFLLNEENVKDVYLLILDRVLPDMDGLDILREFSTKSKAKIPTLILSVLNSESDILSGLQGGAVDYIAKPFSVFFLVQKALNLLKSEK
jgi:CheY-like chemotaxis protein